MMSAVGVVILRSSFRIMFITERASHVVCLTGVGVDSQLN